MSALEKHFADEFFRLIIWTTLIVAGFFIVIATSIYFAGKNQKKCSDDQLNIVIDKVHECKKKNVICPHSDIERLIKEVCGK